MAVFKLPLKLNQGETFVKTVTWKTGTAPGTPVNLTGCTARMQVRSAVTSPTVLLELSTANGRIVLGTTNGEVSIRLTATETAALAWTSGVYDLEVVFPDSTVRRLLSGAVSVSPEVTRD